MVKDRWYSLDVPILEFIDSRRLVAGVITAREIAEVVKADRQEVASELERLCNDGYLDASVYKPGGADKGEWQLNRSALTGKGLRVVGAWPSEDPYQALLELLDQKIEQTEDGGQRSKLQALKASLADIGRAVIAGLLVELAKASSR